MPVYSTRWWMRDQIERAAEPCVDRETAARFPVVADTRVVAYFLHVRGRKPR